MEDSKVVASVVIPNWNGINLIKVCLKSLRKQSFKNFETIVVDNGSTDGSAEFIKNKYPQVVLVKLDRNIGFAPAVNLGIKRSKGRYVILINNDTEVEKDCVRYLVQSAQDHPEVGFVATKMLNFYNRNLIDCAGDYIDEVGHANNIGKDEKDGIKFNKPGYIFLATGGGSLFKRGVFDKVSLLDDRYFAYMEDVDLCLRAQLVGFKGWYEPKAVIYHIQRATSSRNEDFAEYLRFRNMTMTIIKDFPKGLLLHRMNWLRIFWVNINTVRFFMMKGRLKEALKAELYIIQNLKRLLNDRQKIQKAKVVSDGYIINNVKEKRLTLFGIFPKGI